VTCRKILWHCLVKNCGIGIQSALIKRECFDVVGLFDERLPMLEDLEIFIRLESHFQFYHIRETRVCTITWTMTSF
jgi:hypothetical protein